MKIFVAESCVSYADIAYSEVGFWHFDQKRAAPFSIVTDFYSFQLGFYPVYEECIRELERDDRMVGIFQPPYPEAGSYPSASELWELSPENRMEMISTYFVFDVLGLVLQEEKEGACPAWSIKRLDSVEKVGGDLVVTGIAESRASASGE